MSLLEIFRGAVRGLVNNKMRSALTMLGMIIGVGVVIIVVSIGQGASQQVTAAVNSLGTNLLTVMPGSARVRVNAATRSGDTTQSNRLTLDDARLMAQLFPTTIDAVAPQARGNVQIRLGSNDSTTNMTGTTPEYLYVNNADVGSGRMFTQSEVDATQKVCVIGTTVAEKLTGSARNDLTGKAISINRQSFDVVGMLAQKGSGANGQDQDDLILMPVTTALRRILNRHNINSISVRCTTQQMMPLAQEQISSFLRNRHHVPPPYPDNDDFNIRSQTELMERQQSVTSTMTSLLSLVAVISLVVGGIGIMNIMLVSVTERTREIGIRKAIGATPRDILMQFLTEASLISILGGMVGIAAGVGGSLLVAKIAGWNTLISIAAIVAALIVSVGVGLFFGIYPASKASRMHPIDALRFE